MSLFLNALLLLASSSNAASSDAVSSALDAHVQEIVGWVRNQGGYFNDKLHIRRVDPTDLTSDFGVFAKKNMKALEDLMMIPASAMIWAVQPENPSIENRVLCDLTHVLMKELKLGEESTFAPFVKLLSEQARGQLPATWSEAGKDLISHVVSSPDRHDLKMTSWMETNFEHKNCIQSGNAFEQQAVALVVQRGWDTVLIPIYDMINHINDLSKRNTDNSSVHGEEGINVWASRAIEAGEQIFMSYDNCHDCYSTPEEWGTPEILRDFGFVEAYPQTFYFREAEALFSVDKITDDEDLEITWHVYDSPDAEGIVWMKEEYHRLVDLQFGGFLAKTRNEMPEEEWNTIFHYHQSLTVALNRAIQVAIDNLEDSDEDVEEDDEEDL